MDIEQARKFVDEMEAEQERWERYKEAVDRVLRYGTAGGILGR